MDVLDIVKLGSRYGPSFAAVEPEAALAYAEATNDDVSAYRSGPLVPPVFGVVPTWDVMLAAVLDVVPADALPMLVHLSHDMHFHRPLEVGQVLATAAEVHSIRSLRSGGRLTVLVTSTADGGAPLLDQYATMFVRGLGGGESGGPEPPDHAFPSTGRGQPVAQRTTHVDLDQTYRYRDASGDDNPIHVDEGAALAAGLPGIIVHGLCTMAMCGQVVVADVAGGDPSLVRRLAVRFSRPVLPGRDLVTTLWELDGNGHRRRYGFEARSEGLLVVRDGRAELGPAERR
jgi:acyl dehydratase